MTTTLTAPGSRQWGFTYNDAGQPASYTWPNGMTTNYTYDTAGRLTGLEHKDGATVKAGWAYELSNDDNIVRVADTRAGIGQAWEYEYDARGRLIHALRFNDSGLPQFRQAFAYDAADNLSSVMKFNLSQVVRDTFADGDYTANPVWTVWSGTWSAASYYLAPAPEDGRRAISTPSTTRSPDLRVDYYLPPSLNSILDAISVYVRYWNTTNNLRVVWALGSLFVIETVNGTETYLAVYPAVSATMNSWQTLYVQLRNEKLSVYHAPQGRAPRLIGGEIPVSSTMNTTQFRLAVGGQSGFRFDNVSVHARSLVVEGSTAHTYNSANQLVTSTTNGVVTNHTYDPWGRLATRTQGAYAASYEWRYGDKLKAVTSNFPGEAALVAYDYDGLGKRRSRTTGAGMTWWRWGLGWDTLAEYTDPDTDGDIEGFSKFNVMMGMMHPLAEATVPSGQPPANAAYSYLALDHLSSTRAVFSQAKAQTAAMEFYPYGGRLSTSGTLPHHQFTAKPYDTGTGQYYFPYRYYAPAMARWTAADPAGTVDGPNVYCYVQGRPNVRRDGLGLQMCKTDKDCCDLQGRYVTFCCGLTGFLLRQCKKRVDRINNLYTCQELCKVDFLHSSECCNLDEECLKRADATYRNCMIGCTGGPKV